LKVIIARHMLRATRSAVKDDKGGGQGGHLNGGKRVKAWISYEKVEPTVEKSCLAEPQEHITDTEKLIRWSSQQDVFKSLVGAHYSMQGSSLVGLEPTHNAVGSQ